MSRPRADASHWAAILALDARALEYPGDHLEPLTGDDGPAPAWSALMRGDAVALEARLTRLLAGASAARDSGLVVEATALRALVLSSLNKGGEALVFARRASMMARTEADPTAELLANIVLARMRRHAGKPHLAVRILEALARFAPAAPQAWLDWERLLAGGTGPETAAASDATTDATGDTPAAIGRRLLHAARLGQRAPFEQAAAALLNVTAAWRDIQDEARVVIELLDADRAPSSALDPFRFGIDEALIYGLHGFRVVPVEHEPGISVFAVARPGERGRRILVDGLALFGDCRVLVCEDAGRRTHGRTDAGLATLVLAGPDPTPEADFFRRVYGFVYAPAIHRGVMDVLLHRMRKRLEPIGTIVRAEGRLALALREAIAVADPRCAPSAAARILSALARQPLATADGVASRLGITVRAAQMALAQLVSDGACVMRRAGHHLEFQLQDTTFREPTGSDLLAGGKRN
jgi:hypothetical protein